jgi:hypothetical protein
MVALLALSVAGITADVAAAEVRLRPTASCSSSVIRLADVAEVIASDSRLGQALADVMLCPAPPAGEERTLSANDVRQMLSLSGVEQRDFRMQGSETVTVRFQAIAGLAPANRPVMVYGVRQAVFAEERHAATVRPAPAIVKPAQSSSKPAIPPLVERGATVTVIARAAGVRITSSGKALEAGREGEAINVELADDKQRLLATVTGPQTVEIAAAGLQ